MSVVAVGGDARWLSSYTDVFATLMRTWRLLDSYEAAQPFLTNDSKVTIQSGADDDSHPYYVEIQNPDEYVVGNGNTVPGPGYETWETEIESLYRAARNNALGVDKTLGDLAAELSLPSDPQFPF